MKLKVKFWKNKQKFKLKNSKNNQSCCRNKRQKKKKNIKKLLRNTLL